MYTQDMMFWCMAFFLLNTYGWYLFYTDKRKAIRSRPFRTPETTFFLVAACGGGCGALLGMLLHRHKTKHVKFKLLIPSFALISVFFFWYGWQYIM